MAHLFDIRFRRPIAAGDAHKVRNFIEDVWVSAAREGWADFAQLDARIKSMEDLSLQVPARASHEATTLISRLVAKHMMEELVEVVRAKKASARG